MTCSLQFHGIITNPEAGDAANVCENSANHAVSYEESPEASDAETENSYLELGSIIESRYRIECVLGTGCVAVVYRACDIGLDRQVALKVMRRRWCNNAQLLRRFVREARIGAQLRSEHVARVFDYGALPSGVPYMIMELLQGMDLSDVILRYGPLPCSVVANYISQVCRGLREAHTLGIVHRDLKPANLFLTFDARGSEVIKILDFGFAKESRNRARGPVLTNACETVGSPCYMSPEQLTQPTFVDPTSDVWALGVVMYELLVGYTPFEGMDLAELSASVLSEPLRRIRDARPDVDPAFEAVVLRCLERDRARRYPNVDELANELRQFKLHGEQSSVSLRATAFNIPRPILQENTTVASLANGVTPVQLPRRAHHVTMLVGALIAATFITIVTFAVRSVTQVSHAAAAPVPAVSQVSAPIVTPAAWPALAVRPAQQLTVDVDAPSSMHSVRPISPSAKPASQRVRAHNSSKRGHNDLMNPYAKSDNAVSQVASELTPQ